MKNFNFYVVVSVLFFSCLEVRTSDRWGNFSQVSDNEMTYSKIMCAADSSGNGISSLLGRKQPLSPTTVAVVHHTQRGEFKQSMQVIKGATINGFLPPVVAAELHRNLKPLQLHAYVTDGSPVIMGEFHQIKSAVDAASQIK